MPQIQIPKTRAELAQSHFFSAFIFPQQFGRNDDLSSMLLNVGANNVLAGVRNVSKNFGKDVEQRYSLNSPYESSQTIPKRLSYAMTLNKVVFYNEGESILKNHLEIEGNGFMKQMTPFILEEIIKNPDGTIKQDNFYLDTWFVDERIEYSLEDDLLVVKAWNVKTGRMLTKQNDFVGIAQAALGLTTSGLQILDEITQESNKILKNFEIPS